MKKRKLIKDKYILLSYKFIKNRKRRIKRIKYNISVIKIILKIIFIFILLHIYIFFSFKNKKNLSFIKINQKIIESNYYESFENMKHRYINNKLFKPYLETITIINHLYPENYKDLKKDKNNIHICVSLTDKYIYPQLVSIESVLINSDKYKSFLIYHILCAPDVTDNTLSILKSLIYKYPINLEIILYNMTNNFMNLNDFRVTQASAYRLATPFMMDVDRIIHLDGDTLTFKDLNKMYSMDLGDNYILGFLDIFSEGIDYLGIQSKTYVNAGTIILNLEKIRNDNKIEDIFNFINKKPHLKNLDQTIMNYVFYPKIGILPPEFAIWNFYDESDIKRYAMSLRTKINITEMVESLNNPTIIHTCLCDPKIWNKNTKFNAGYTACTQRRNCSCEKYHILWDSYAKKTDYYKEIQHFIYEKL